MKIHHIGLSALALTTVASLAGCGGSSGQGPASLSPLPTTAPTQVPANQRFNGQYTGNFAGVTPQGDAVRGVFLNRISGTGQIAGVIQQSGFPDFPASGSIDTNGNLVATATPPGFISTLTGKIVLDNGGAISSGNLITRLNNQLAVTGIFAGARAEATANPFAGNYSGSFDGGANIRGTFVVTADSNGAASGTITQPGLGQYATVGTISRQGVLSVRAINTFPGQPSIILLTTLTGRATTTGGATTATGTFNTTANGQQNASGTFTATRQ